MTTENGLKVFSLRLPERLANQIDARAALNHRTRNAEIVVLLEQAIDLNVQRDKRLLDTMREATEVKT